MAEAEHVSVIRCPRCGGTERFRLVERADVSRRVLGVDRDGNVEVDARAVVESLDLGIEARFECQHVATDGTTCAHRWPLPEWVVHRLVYY